MKHAQTNPNTLSLTITPLLRSVCLSLGLSFLTLVPSGTKAQEPRTVRIEAEHVAMGVTFKFVVYAVNEPCAIKAIHAAKKRVDELDACLSDYRSASEVSRLCETAPHAQFVPASNDLWQIANRSNELSALTDGAFDVTVGPISHLWRAAIKRNRLPEQSKIESALAAVGANKLQLRLPNLIRLTTENMQLDFGGIAKGFAADAALAVFAEHDIESALVDASGDVSVLGLPTDATAWRIILPKQSNVAEQTLLIPRGAVATSGDLYQSLTIDGQHYSHIINPKSGQPVSHVSRTTVYAIDGATADALATAFSVLEPNRVIEIAAKMDSVAVQILIRNPAGSAEPFGKIESTNFSQLKGK